MQINFEKVYYGYFKFLGFLRKQIIGIVIFTVVEFFTFVKFEPSDMESFFLFWAFISIVFLGFSVFNIAASDSYSTYNYTGHNQYGNFKMAELEKKFETEAGKKRIGGGISDSINFIYVFFLVANIAGYIKVMP